MRAVITGGGTGGHLFPGIALACALQERHSGSEILFIGTPRLLDQQALRNRGFQLATLSSSGVKGLGLGAQIRSLLSQPAAIWQARQMLRRFKPALVFGVGGYVTGPVLLAAKLMGIPTAIHEQNSVPGLANRLAGRLVDKICISIPCQPAFPPHKTVRTGNPVRAEIVAASQQKSRGGQAGNIPSLLVLGGSQGAHALNERMVAVMGILHNRGLRLQLQHQTGSADAAMVQDAYRKTGVQAEVKPFIEDMAAAYASADLVVSRAGATSLAELAVMGLPAILVPYPFAADDHQASNAEYYVQGGGAVMYREKDLTPEILAAQIQTLLEDEQRHRMAEAMRALGQPDAAERLVDECFVLVAGKDRAEP
ncbi:MAG: undecaprenyldiphospho-muramoylpentapeptide beta-N-acetylglucosaminyltransferase [Desulfobulbaceae bacterium]|nr:undecaprenyldiphospho-muramoylpentapeptide beta-N-acetylglucosaminyltransferase [Desulfobulbaceae bacterium]